MVVHNLLPGIPVRKLRRLTVVGGGGSGVGAPFLSPFLLLVGDGGGPGIGVDGGGV